METLLVVGVLCIVVASLIVGAVWRRADHPADEGEEVSLDDLMVGGEHRE